VDNSFISKLSEVQAREEERMAHRPGREKK